MRLLASFFHSRSYLLLLSRTQTPEEFLNHYSKIVPIQYSLQSGLVIQILQTFAANSAANCVPQLWSDAVYSQCASQTDMLEAVTAALASGKGPSQTQVIADNSVDPVLATALSVWKHFESVIMNNKKHGRPVSVQLRFLHF